MMTLLQIIARTVFALLQCVFVLLKKRLRLGKYPLRGFFLSNTNTGYTGFSTRALLVVSSFLFVLAFLAPTVYAVSSDFTIETLVGGDTTPPTIPQNLTATPVAMSQINLAWSPSTDDFSVAGYHVFRDSVPVATTTNPNYADVGLFASTTYTYNVTAFDTFNNISTSSSLVATTTFSSSTPPVVVVPTTTPQGTIQYGSVARSQLTKLEILPGHDSVTIRYETNEYVEAIVHWGRTTSYELGSLVERSFAMSHETNIVGLTPGVTYSFEIDGVGPYGMRTVLTQSTFTTLSEKDTFPPGNVENLHAVKDGNAILLSWKNPADTDLTKIRVVRSNHFYPSDPADGWVVYEGMGETVRDRNSTASSTTEYYTVFSYDVLGNISSGAVVAIRTGLGSSTVALLPIPIDETKNPLALSFDDLQFFQGSTPLLHTGERVAINGAQRLMIALPYARVPEHLKTILVTLTNTADTESSFSFLLRINADTTAYVATLAPLGVSGVFPIRISVFDYTTEQVGYTHGSLNSTIARVPHEAPPQTSFDRFILILFTSFNGYLMLFILLLIVLAYLARRVINREH